MAFFDEITSVVNRGTAAAGRSADKIKINARISEINKQRQNMAAQLGASLYEATRNDSLLRAGREALYDGIASLDTERENCRAQIAALEEQAVAAATAAAGFNCSVCGAQMTGADMFCAGCGSPVAKARASVAAANGPSCATCSAPISADDMFCMNCGAKVEEAETKVIDSELGYTESKEQ